MKLVGILTLFSFIFTLQGNAKKRKQTKDTLKNHLEEWTVLKTGKFSPAGQSRYQSTRFFFCLFFFCFATEGEQYLISAEDTENNPTPSESRARVCILPSPLSIAEIRDYSQSTIPKYTRFCLI